MNLVRTLLFPWPGVAKAALAPLDAKGNRHVAAIMLPLVLTTALVWWVTVPVHELLHVAGCKLAGGDISELTIQPIYGGTLLARVFDFVTPGGDYAGQLKGFDTHGNDFTYFVTSFFPYLLTILLGVTVLRLAARSGNPILHGVGLVNVVLPVASLAGDYYELGSIVVTRLAGMAPLSPEAELIRGDDVARVYSRVAEAGLDGGVALVVAGFATGVFLAGLTLGVSIFFADAVRANGSTPPNARPRA